MSKYPSKQKQIEEFGVWILFCGVLHRVASIEEAQRFYEGKKTHLHHYIREQMYYRNPERFKGMQKLIMLPSDLHWDLHAGTSDATFLRDNKVERDVLLYRKRKAY